jgi:transposase InsO family protein
VSLILARWNPGGGTGLPFSPKPLALTANQTGDERLSAQVLRSACLVISTGTPAFVLHDRDSIFSACDAEMKGFGVRVLKTPVRAPKANGYCERLVGTIRRECLDFLIPLNEGHLNRLLKNRPATAGLATDSDL